MGTVHLWQVWMKSLYKVQRFIVGVFKITEYFFVTFSKKIDNYVTMSVQWEKKWMTWRTNLRNSWGKHWKIQNLQLRKWEILKTGNVSLSTRLFASDMTCNTTFNSCSLVNRVTFLSILFSYISNIAKLSIDKLRIFGNFLMFYGFQIEMSFSSI